MSYSLGAIPSRHDPRDHLVHRYMAVQPETLPAEYACENLPPVHDQGQYGTCVAETLTAIKEWEERQEWGRSTRFSVAFVYGNRATDGSEPLGEGMEPRAAMKHLRQDGVCPWDVLPGRGTYPLCYSLITPEARTAARPWVIEAFARATSVNELKAAIFHTGPCLIAIPVYESFFTPGTSGRVPRVKPGERLEGYHAMMVYGWTADGYLRVQNSWGEGWGDHGHCLLPADYFSLDPAVPEDRRMEAWTIVDRVLAVHGRTITLRIGDRSYLVDNQVKTMDVAPFIRDGRTMVTLRFIAEAFGYWVDWDPDTRTVTIVQPAGR